MRRLEATIMTVTLKFDYVLERALIIWHVSRWKPLRLVDDMCTIE
jgi:hypothetical protein